MRFSFAFALLTLAACSGGAPAFDLNAPAAAGSRSPSARPELVATLTEDLAARRHPSDGGGRAWLEAGAPATVTASSAATFPVVYEAGPLGVAVGGMVVLMPSPFWGWSGPQVEDPRFSGFTTATTDAAGVELTLEPLGREMLAVTIGGRALAAGEQLRLVYGAAPAGAVVDRYAEGALPLWVAVDGDGDGVRQVLAASPTVAVVAGPAARLVAHLPSVARPGERVRLALAVLDATGNGWVPLAATLRLAADAPGLDLATAVTLTPDQRGVVSVPFTAPPDGVVRVAVSGPDGLVATSNPMTVSAAGSRVYWADLHGHSALSDGSGTPDDWYAYARDVAALDVAALTDHDHWGVRFLDREPALWAEIRAAAARAHAPGRFVTLLGYEWTSWLHGHRHVLYFADDGMVLSSLDPATDSPRELWDALSGHPALTFAHHSAGGPVATDWSVPPDPVLEPCTEVVSVHGASEAADAPASIYSAVPGNFVRDALHRGYRLGFVGSGDGHDGHPGLAHLGAASGGVAAILADGLTRDSVRAALVARRVYATNGPRIVLRVAVAGHGMGAVVPVPEGGTASVVVLVEATAPLERVDVVTPDGVASAPAEAGLLSASLVTEASGLAAGDWVYVRVVQQDGGAAWSSPVFFD